MLRSYIHHFGNKSFDKTPIDKISNNSISRNELFKYRILIFNANEYSKDIQSQYLEDIGFTNIDYADQDKELINLINKNSYAVIIFEVLSFNLKTLNTCKIIRNNHNNKDAIVLCATYMYENTLAKCNEFNMNGIILKPFMFNMYKKSIYFHLSNNRCNLINNTN